MLKMLNQIKVQSAFVPNLKGMTTLFSVSAVYLSSTSSMNSKEKYDNKKKLIQPIKMAYTSYGVMSSDWPIIIMHGLLGCKTNWRSSSVIIHKRTNRKIFTVDARNHGASPHTSEMSYYHLAEDVHEFMSNHNIKQATVIGHSMGGRTMMFLALKYPELIEKLIVVDISPITTPTDYNKSFLPDYFEVMKSINLNINVPLSEARKLVDEQMSSVIKHPGTRAFLLTNLVKDIESGNYKWRVNLQAIAKNYNEFVTFPVIQNSFSGPTLFIGGSESNYIKHKYHTDILKLFPVAKFIYIQGAGHLVHIDQPKEFTDVVCKFISQ